MSKVTVKVSMMATCLLDLPYEVLIEIFRRLPKDKLFEISRLCSKLRYIVGDRCLWKDVYISYEEAVNSTSDKFFTFEELYSEPWPVDVVDISHTRIKPPVCMDIDQIVKVTKLKLSSMIAPNKIAMEAILAKYQCTELYLDYNRVDLQGHIMGIAPETFSKQTALEVLSLKGLKRGYLDGDEETETMILLAPILSHCKNLKSLDLGSTKFTNLDDMLGFVEHLPTSLEKLFLDETCPADSFFRLLTESAPNLKELELGDTSVMCPSLLKFQFLEVLRVISYEYHDLRYLYMYLVKFPALKTVYTVDHHFEDRIMPEIRPGFIFPRFLLIRESTYLGINLAPHGIIVKQIKELDTYPLENNFWRVSYAV